jgi:hypothetical protein
VAVIDDLARGERGRRELHAVDDRVQAALQQLAGFSFKRVDGNSRQPLITLTRFC